MKVRAFFLVLFAASACVLTAKADTAYDFNFGPPDFANILTAVTHDGSSPDYTFDIDIKKAAEMPTFDPLFYYAGIGLDKKFPDRLTIWVSDGAKALDHHAYTLGLFGAMALLAMDNGHAGDKWKNAYSVAATADGQLPLSQTDRYFNRHLLRSAVLSYFADKIDMRERVEGPAPKPTATP